MWGEFDWFLTPPAPPVVVPVEFVPIGKMSQGELQKPQVPVKEAEKEEEKSDPKAEEKLPEEPKPLPEKKKEEVAPQEEIKKEEPKKEDAPKPEADPIPLKKKKPEKKKDKKPEKKPQDKKDSSKKDVKKEVKKGSDSDDFEQILKNLDTNPPLTAKGEKKTEAQGKKKNVTNKLSDEAKMSLSDAMLRQVQKCWIIDPGIKDIDTMNVPIHIKLKIDGSVESVEILNKSRMSKDFFYRSLAEGAQRAVYDCAPYNLPPDMYDKEDGWKEMELDFDPRSMLNKVQ